MSGKICLVITYSQLLGGSVSFPGNAAAKRAFSRARSVYCSVLREHLNNGGVFFQLSCVSWLVPTIVSGFDRALDRVGE